MNKNDLYFEVGITLERIQIWEKEFKLLTQHFNIEKSDDKRSLSNMNNFLFRSKIINEEEHLCIKRIIDLRNYIIHRLFIDELSQFKNNNELIKNNIDKSLQIFSSKY